MVPRSACTVAVQESAIRTGTTNAIAELQSANRAERERAVARLCAAAPEAALADVAAVLVRTDDPKVVAACLDVAGHHGAAAALNAVVNPRWFDEVARGTAQFAQVADIVGRRYVAYALMLGIGLRNIIKDPHVEANTVVRFTAPDFETPQELTLPDFRVQVASAVAGIAVPDVPERLSLPIDAGAAMHLVGEVALLVAPLFGAALEMVVVRPDAPAESLVLVRAERSVQWRSVRTVRDLVHRALQRDAARARSSRIQFDISVAPAAARAAARGEYDVVFSLLRAWPSILSALVKSDTIAQLSAEQLAHLVTGLEALIAAYEYTGNDDLAFELCRLGVQCVVDTGLEAGLYARMGSICNRQERYGEAVGYLRRAMALGADADVRIELAHALLARGRTVAAALLLADVDVRGAAGSHPLWYHDVRAVWKECVTHGAVWLAERLGMHIGAGQSPESACEERNL